MVVEPDPNDRTIAHSLEKRAGGHQATGDGAIRVPRRFDGVFGPTSTQEEVYRETGAYAVDNLLRGYNATVFCYGTCLIMYIVIHV